MTKAFFLFFLFFSGCVIIVAEFPTNGVFQEGSLEAPLSGTQINWSLSFIGLFLLEFFNIIITIFRNSFYQTLLLFLFSCLFTTAGAFDVR